MNAAAKKHPDAAPPGVGSTEQPPSLEGAGTSATQAFSKLQTAPFVQLSALEHMVGQIPLRHR